MTVETEPFGGGLMSEQNLIARFLNVHVIVDTPADPGYRKSGFCSHVCNMMTLESLENARNSQRARLEKAAKEVVGHG